MKKTPIKEVKSDLKLARPVYGLMGEILLSQGAELKPHYINILISMGISSVYIKDERLEDISQEDVISEKTKQEAHLLLKSIFTETSKGAEGYKYIAKLKGNISEVSNNIIEDLLGNPNLILNLADIKTEANYHFEHSLNVAVIAAIICLKMEMPLSLIKRNMGGLLFFDIGNAVLPQRLLLKNGTLSEKEHEQIKKHPQHGYRMLTKSEIFSDGTALIAAQHHERLNGHGYPKKLNGKSINLMSQIVAVADVYDALISDRPYRKALYPFQALELLLWMGEAGLNKDVINVLIDFTAAYPIGLHVMLNSGESGLVIDNKPKKSFKPTVRIFYEGKNFAPVKNPYEINLRVKKELKIEKVVSEDEFLMVNSDPKTNIYLGNRLEKTD